MKKGILFFACMITMFSTFAARKIKSVDFLQSGEVSKVVIELDGPAKAQRKHIVKDKQILLDVANATGDFKTLRGIDTSEFAGSTVYIAGYKKPGQKTGVRFAIQLRDNVASFLELVGNKVILNIESRFGVFGKKIKAGVKTAKNLVNDEDNLITDSRRLNVPKSTSILDILQNITLSGPKRYIGKRISINVNNMDVDDILKIIADTSGFNIIIDDEVKTAKPLTLKLTNLPWDQILDTVLDLSKLSAQKRANILTVSTRAKAEEELKAKLAADKAREAQEPLVTKIFPISFGKLEDISKIVEGYLTKDRGSVEADARTNYLIVNDTVDIIERVKKIIDALDTETAQVLIEAKIVEITDRESFDIGLTDGISFGYDPVGAPAADSAEAGSFTFSSSGSDGSVTAPLLGVAISSIKRLVNLDFALELAQQKSHVKIVSSPKVLTQNKQAAELGSTQTVGLETDVITNQTAEAVTQPTSASVDLTLKVTPQVTNEGSINLDIDIAKGDFVETLASRNRAPDTVNRSIKTNVLVDNGSTIAIGGLYKTTRSKSVRGIPVLMDIPIIGWLFRSKNNPSVSRDELMVFITPRIVNQEEAGLTDTNLSAIKSNSIK